VVLVHNWQRGASRCTLLTAYLCPNTDNLPFTRVQTFVSLVTIVIRQYYFLKHFEDAIKLDRLDKRLNREPTKLHFIDRFFSRRTDKDSKQSKNMDPEHCPPLITTPTSDDRLNAKVDSQPSSEGTHSSENVEGVTQSLQDTTLSSTIAPPVLPTGATTGSTVMTDVSTLRQRSAPSHEEVHSIRTSSRFPRNNPAMHTGFGGFTNPVHIAIKYLFMHLHMRVQKRRMPHTMTLQTNRPDSSVKAARSSVSHADKHAKHKKEVNYISFDALVGRNSRFVGLTSEQREELGGVEYRVCSMKYSMVDTL
jgi:hypothetical protein